MGVTTSRQVHYSISVGVPPGCSVTGNCPLGLPVLRVRLIYVGQRGRQSGRRLERARSWTISAKAPAPAQRFR